MTVGPPMSPVLASYRPPACYDELVGFGSEPLAHCASLYDIHAPRTVLEITARSRVNDRYIRVAYGRDYADVTPIKGSYRGSGTSTLDVDVTVGAGRQAQQ